MKKSLILSISALTLLSVSAFGHMSNNEDYSNENMYQQHMMNNNYSNQHMMEDSSDYRNMMHGYNMMGNNYGHMSNYGMMGQGHMGYGMMSNSMMGSMMIFPKIMMLDLSKEQQEKINNIINNTDTNIKNPLDAFSDTSFDKDKYIKLLEKNRELMIQSYAEKISKVYSILTTEQKKNLKKIIDVQHMYKNSNNYYMHHNMMNR